MSFFDDPCAFGIGTQDFLEDRSTSREFLQLGDV